MKHLILLSLVLLTCANLATAAELPLSGSCGNGCFYEITTNANGKKDLRVYNAPTYEGTAYIANAAFAGKGYNPSGDYEEYYTNASFDKITIDGNFDSIGSNAFWHSNATEIAFNGNVREVGYRAFEYNNFTELNLPETLKNIAEQAFYGNKLTSLVIPDSVEFMGYATFNQPSKALSYVYTSDNLDSLGNATFRYEYLDSLSIICKGDMEKCIKLAKEYKYGGLNIDISDKIVAATEPQCTGLSYYWSGKQCNRRNENGYIDCAEGWYATNKDVCEKIKLRYTLPEADEATSDDNENMIEWIFE